MSIAENGDAIICGNVVRKCGVEILRAVASFAEPATVPEIATSLADRYSDNHLYTTLQRLLEKPNLLVRTEANVTIQGWSGAKKVVWKTTPEVKQFFMENPPP